MRGRLLRRWIIFGISILLVATSVIPGISKDIPEQIKKNNIGSALLLTPVQTTSISLYIFGKTGLEKHDVILSSQNASKLYARFQELKAEIIAHPFSENTQQMKKDFITQLAENKVIPSAVPSDEYDRLLNPPWFEKLRTYHNHSAYASPPTLPTTPIATAFMCSLTGEGLGVLFPFLMIPRPRIITTWTALEGTTTVGKLLLFGGFTAEGAQFGTALGFWGIGLAFATPYGTLYGLIGYALFTTVAAQSIQRYPPNHAPIIIGTDPGDSDNDVPVSLSEIRFSIEDPDGDLMSYTVTTNPDIGRGNGTLKPAGTYAIQVHNLQELTQYQWTLTVSDNELTTQQTFSFTTQATAPVVSNPSPENGAQDVPMDIQQLQFTLKDYQGDPMEFTVQTQPNIGSDHKVGIHNGTYSVPISGLTYGATYRWFVNVTDGSHWTHKIFSFETGYPSLFNPFEYGWQYRKQITIDHTKVAEDLTNFPVLISSLDSDLVKAQDDGGDILFMNSTGVAKKRYHEIESFDQATGHLVAWVNVPAVSSSQDTILYMYYGNPTCINQQNPKKTWTSHYTAVWHLNTNPIDPIVDSTMNGNDGTSQGSMTQSDLVEGKIGPCLHFDGIDDYISFGEFTNTMDQGTLIVWAQTTSSEISAIWVEATKSADKPYITCGKYQDDLLYFGRDVEGGSTNYQGFKSTGMNDGQWHQIVWQSKGDGNGNYFYFDGQPISLAWQGGQDPNGIWFDDQPTDTHSLGAYDRESPSLHYHWNGLFDEVRIADIPFSAGWISTEYNNQNDPSGFLAFGPEQPGP